MFCVRSGAKPHATHSLGELALSSTRIVALVRISRSHVGSGKSTTTGRWLFNSCGTLVWYPVPAVRKVPIMGARMLEKVAADIVWFTIAYIVFMFLVVPFVSLGKE